MRVLKLVEKKTTVRDVQITPDVVESVKAYQQSSRKSDDQVMFKSGPEGNETSRWIMSLTRFFQKHNIAVQSHDFRTTMITNFYNNCKDLAKTKKFSGHASIKMVERYVKVDKEKMHEENAEFLQQQMPGKRARV